jgi:hypothetical protein
MAKRAVAAALNLTGNQLCWLAGITEAEGSFIAGTPSHPRRTVMHVTTTDDDIAQRLSDLLGVRISIQKPSKDHYKQPYRVVLAGGSAVSLMNLLYPYMGERRRVGIEYARASHQPRQSYPHLTFHSVPDEVEEHNRYWLAGYLEGEGSFALEKHVKPYATYFRPLVGFNSTDRDVLVHVQHLLVERYYCRVSVYPADPGYEGAKTTYRLKVRGRKAVKIMQDVYPLMGRRRQAKIVEILTYTK